MSISHLRQTTAKPIDPPLEEQDRKTLRAHSWERREAPTYQRTRRRINGERAVTARRERFFFYLKRDGK